MNTRKKSGNTISEKQFNTLVDVSNIEKAEDSLSYDPSLISSIPDLHEAKIRTFQDDHVTFLAAWFHSGVPELSACLFF